MNIKDRAKQFAIAAHDVINQKRKYTGEPYWVHVVEVAEIVESVGGDDAMIAAAFLHDTVEDTGVSLETIENEFGGEVADLVEQLTDISTVADGNRAQRKAKDRAHTARASARAKTIKLADLISNTKSIVDHDPGFAKIYIKEKELLLPFLKEGNADLWQRANELVENYKGK